MFELAFIEQCADPSLEIGIVERFISEIGTANPLAITITDGNRIILDEPPETPNAGLSGCQRSEIDRSEQIDAHQLWDAGCVVHIDLAPS